MSIFDDIIYKTEETVSVGENEFIQYQFNPNDFMNVSTAWFGQTKSGKSFHMNHILYLMRKQFGRVIVWCPTNKNHNDYTDKVNKCLIYDELTEANFLRVHDAQEEIAEMYRSYVQNITLLREVFNLCASDRQREYIRDIEQHVASIKHEIEYSKAPDNIKSQKYKDLNDKVETNLRAFYKNIIIQNRQSIDIKKLSIGAQNTLKYIDLIPDTLFIFDDCQSEIDSISKKKNSRASQEFKNMFTRGRHKFITHFYTLQDNAAMPALMRKNLKNVILTQQGVASQYITTLTNGISKDDQKIGLSLANKIFSEGSHKKIICFSERTGIEKFQYHTAEPSGIFFTNSTIINNFCNEVSNK